MREPLYGWAVLKRLRSEIYGSTEALFDVPGSPEEAARVLAQATPRTALSTLTNESIVGSVSVDRVVLRRHRPFLNNSFAPVYRGQFQVRSGRTQLCGTLQLHLVVQVFMTIWFGLLMLFVPIAVVAGISSAAKSGSHWGAGLIAGLAMAGPALLMGLAGFGLVRFGKWLARDDGARIKEHICRTFGSSAV